jgi:hypothetical protein
MHAFIAKLFGLSIEPPSPEGAKYTSTGCSPVYSFVRAFIRLCIRWLVRAFVHPLVRAIIHSFVRALIHSFVHPSVPVFVHSRLIFPPKVGNG